MAAEDVNELSLAEKVARSEAKFNLCDAALSELKAEQLMQLQRERPLLSDMVANGCGEWPAI